MYGVSKRSAPPALFACVPLLSVIALGFHPAHADNLVAILPLDEGSGQVATDVTGNGWNGLLVNGPVYSADTPDGSAYALRFDGVDDYIDLGALDAGGSGITLAAWFKADEFPEEWRDGRLISRATGMAEHEHIFMLSTVEASNDTRLRGRIRVNGITETLIAREGNLTTNVWYHAALTYDGLALRLYLDGTEVGSASAGGPIDSVLGVPVTVGAQPPSAGGKHFDGLMDDVRIWKRALDSNEIAALVADNSLPVAVPDEYQVYGGSIDVDASEGVLANDVDADDVALTAVLASDTSHGSLVLYTDGAFSYIPTSGYEGEDRFSYRAFDGSAYSSAADVYLSVVPEEPPPNSPPLIEGTPPATVLQQESYRFLPTASDPDGDPLTFEIENAPAWASFDPATGELHGVPGAEHVGTYTGISIAVTDGSSSAQLPAFSIEVHAIAVGAATISWRAPTGRTDGSSLLNLAGFEVFWGKEPGQYTNSAVIDNPGTTRYVVENLSSGTYYFAVKAFDSAGITSEFSAGVSTTLPQ